jgi:hypothetical protein
MERNIVKNAKRLLEYLYDINTIIDFNTKKEEFTDELETKYDFIDAMKTLKLTSQEITLAQRYLIDSELIRVKFYFGDVKGLQRVHSWNITPKGIREVENAN